MKSWWSIDWKYSGEAYSQKGERARIELTDDITRKLIFSANGENGELTASYDLDSRELSVTNCGHTITRRDYEKLLSLRQIVEKGTLPPEIKNGAERMFNSLESQYREHRGKRLLTYQQSQ